MKPRDDKPGIHRTSQLSQLPMDRILIWTVLSSKALSKLLQAELMAEFLRPMLEYEPERRATAQEMLSHPWLSSPVTEPIGRASATSAATAAPEDERTRRRPTQFNAEQRGSPAGLAPKRSR